MAQYLFFYELSQAADSDLNDIYDYTAREFGDAQAEKYLTSFEAIFQNLCVHPALWRKRDDVRKGLRSISNESHTIFYRVLKDRIRIVRVMHGSRDVFRFLKQSR
jgi:toxin ParE1/3/4